MRTESFTFLGGSQDGKTLPVPLPIRTDIDFLVRPEAPYLPWETYRLGDDGRFHYLGLNLAGRSEQSNRVGSALADA